jgi:hypothetical protein
VIAKRAEVWRSSFLAQEVAVARWGEDGRPVLLFPTAGGDAEEVERFRMVEALAPLVRAGGSSSFLRQRARPVLGLDAYPPATARGAEPLRRVSLLRARALHASSRGQRE